MKKESSKEMREYLFDAWRIYNEYEFHCYDVWSWNGCAYDWFNHHVQMGAKEK